MSFTLRIREKLRKKANESSSRKSSQAASKQAAAKGDATNGRSITFDFDNELTRQRALRRTSTDSETIVSGHGVVPPAYARSRRDSGVSAKSDDRDLYRRRWGHSRDASPMSRRSMSSSRPVSAQVPRLSLSTDDGRRLSLGPSMEQWRREEDEEWQMARRNGDFLMPLTPALTSTSTISSAPVSPALSAWPTQSPFDGDKGRRLSIVAAMEQWRLEDDEDAPQAAETAPVLLRTPSTPTSVPASPAWPEFSKRPSVSSPWLDDGRRMSLGVAMEQWRVEEDEEVRAAKNVPLPSLTPPESPQLASKWPAQSPFDEGRRTSVVTAMEQWRVEEEMEEQAAQVTSPALASRQARSSFGHGVDGTRIASLGPAMEQWRLEELEDWKKDDEAVAAPLPSRKIEAPASAAALKSRTGGIMSLGPAMEMWRLEEVY